MSQDLLQHQHVFFIGVAGAGMSAIAQYLRGIGKQVSGSDRLFTASPLDTTRNKLEAEGIQCFHQDGSGISELTQMVVISTAIEESNPEIVKARALHIPIVLRADLLAAICASRKTIAVAGTSGKSTVTGMLFHTLHACGWSPSFISGAGLVSIQQQGKIGNAHVGNSDWLIIEADESDGTLVKYHPYIGLLLSIDKDHKEISELNDLFRLFQSHTHGHFIVNASHPLAAALSTHSGFDFGKGTTLEGQHFVQQGFEIKFSIPYQNEMLEVTVPTIGEHNMENALACLAVARCMGLPLPEAVKALSTYGGIYRRHQLLGEHHGILVIDDYAHNPAKIAASIKACQPMAPKLVAWFQPHGYGPTRFIRHELVQELAQTLRPTDEIWMSEIYYAGGTAVKDISAADLIKDLQAKGIQAHFVANRNELFETLVPQLQPNTVLLLMGARDPGLEDFTAAVNRMVKDKN